jgi:hypothetical protein
MNFGQAIDALKENKPVARRGWNGKNMHIYLVIEEPYEPCIYMLTAQEKMQPGWLASQADMLAEDWYVVA